MRRSASKKTVQSNSTTASITFSPTDLFRSGIYSLDFLFFCFDFLYTFLICLNQLIFMCGIGLIVIYYFRWFNWVIRLAIRTIENLLVCIN
jgi:hypothetical protein